MCKCNRTGLFLHGGALGGAVVVVGSATQIGLLTHLHRPSPPRRRRRLRCRPRITRRRLGASTRLVRVVVGLPRRYVTFPFLMVQGARCCVATCPGVLRVEGVRCDGGERRLLALVRAGRNAAVRVIKLGPQSTPDDVQRVRHGGVSTQRRPPAADGLGGGGAGRRWWRGSPMLLCESKKSQSAERSGGRRRRGAQTADVGRLPRSGFFRGRRRASRSVPAGFWGLRAGAAHRPAALFAAAQRGQIGPPAAPNPQISF